MTIAQPPCANQLARVRTLAGAPAYPRRDRDTSMSPVAGACRHHPRAHTCPRAGVLSAPLSLSDVERGMGCWRPGSMLSMQARLKREGGGTRCRPRLRRLGGRCRGDAPAKGSLSLLCQRGP